MTASAQPEKSQPRQPGNCAGHAGAYSPGMTAPPEQPLRRGWTTGACATAALKAALTALWTGQPAATVTIRLPRGECPDFAIAALHVGDDWAEAAVIKDAGDDPDVTHGAEIRVRVAASAGGVRFLAGDGVGTITKPGLPIAVGEPAINPVPRKMMEEVVAELAGDCGRAPDVAVTVSVTGGAELARKTWNPRLGIVGGLSVLGTTGIVRPFSCSAWIASIQRGIDVARAEGLGHVAGCTGAQSEAAVQRLHSLPEGAMLDMGDFAGGLIGYLVRHPVGRLTIGGGPAKLAKLGQGARDLHSARSTVDMARLAADCGVPGVADAGTVLQALDIAGAPLADTIARQALDTVTAMIGPAAIVADVVVCDRVGTILAKAGPR